MSESERSNHVLLNEIAATGSPSFSTTQYESNPQSDDIPDTNTEYSRNLYSYVYDFIFNRGGSRSSSRPSNKSSTQYSSHNSYTGLQPKKCCVCSIGMAFILLLVGNEVVQWKFCSNIFSASVAGPTTDAQLSSKWCVPCTRFKLSPSFKDDKLRKFSKHIRNNTVYCCANDDTFDDFLSLFVDQILREKSYTVTACTCTPSQQLIPIGHIVGAKVKRKKKGKNQCQQSIPIKEWDTQTTGTILRRVGYEPGNIIILVSGWYKVYSQVYYTYQPGHPNCSIYHLVYRNTKINNNFVDQLLFQSGKSTNRMDHGTWEYTSHIGGLAKLKAGDKIFVKVSHPSLVSANPKGSYFGLQFVDN